MGRKRRVRGEGSIYFRASDQTWVGSISLGQGTDGKRRRRVVYGKTAEEVSKELRRIQCEYDTGALADVTKLKVGEYLDRWLSSTAKARVQPRTWHRYEEMIRLRLKPCLPDLPLARLRSIHVEGCHTSIRLAGASPSVCQSAAEVLRSALRDAVRLKMIPFNPAEGVERPKYRRPEMQALSREQALLFLQAAKEDRLFALYVVALDTGMRQGELLALEWADVDLDAGVVVVRRTLEDQGGKLRVKEPKTAKSRRRIDLSHYALDALLDHRKRILAEGNARAPVFCAPEGGYLRKSNLRKRSFLPTLARANAKEAEQARQEGREPRPLPPIRFHDLRHTCATLLLLADENPKVISERLGHANIQMTLNTYSHVLPTMQKRAASKMDGILRGPGNPGQERASG
jgi:integrase